MPKESLKQQAYNIIKDKIITCEYPPNMDINEAFLLQDTGLSRTPIRDALSRLEQERLITIMAKKGVRISDVTINDINMIYETRNLLEPYVIRRYGDKMDKQKLSNMRVLFEELFASEAAQNAYTGTDLRYRNDVDDGFHQYITQVSGNNYLIMSMNHINNQNSRLRSLTSIARSRLLVSHPEHIRIIDFLLQEKYEDAAMAMESHLSNFREAAFRAIIENGGWTIN